MNHHLVVQDGEKTVGVVHIEENKYYFALKATALGEAVRKTSDLDLKRLKKKVEKNKAVLIFGSLWSQKAKDSHPLLRPVPN